MTQPFNKRKVSSWWSIAQSTQQLPRTLTLKVEFLITRRAEGVFILYYWGSELKSSRDWWLRIPSIPRTPREVRVIDMFFFKTEDWIWSKVSKWNDSRDAWNPSLWEFCKVTSAGKPGDVKANVSPIRTIRNLTLKGKESYLTVCFLALGKEGVMKVRCHVLGKVL